MNTTKENLTIMISTMSKIIKNNSTTITIDKLEPHNVIILEDAKDPDAFKVREVSAVSQQKDGKYVVRFAKPHESDKGLILDKRFKLTKIS